MGLCRLTTRKFGHIRTELAFQIVAGILLLAAFAQGQAQKPLESGTVQGTVRDSNGHPIAAVGVSLHLKQGMETLFIATLLTDSAGQYRFSGLHEGSYTLRAERAGYAAASVDEIALGNQQVKDVDVMLRPSNPVRAEDSAGGAPEFYDQPSFTIAGVTDPSNLGGHGSDTIVRTKESLAKAAASLGREAPASAGPEPSASQTEKTLRDAVEREPGNFDTTYRLGKLLVDGGKAREALPYLERASRLNPGSYESAYETAIAYEAIGEYENARSHARALLARRENAEVHHLLGNVEEKTGNPLPAVREYQRAAELNPSEAYVFDWGAELLVHRAPEPAIEVFTEGNRRFQQSARMLVGLGAAEYSRGLYGQAAQHLCAALDLNPDDPGPYRFMGKMQNVESPQAEAISERLERFARLQPENAEANYYYALDLKRRRKAPDDASTLRIEALLQKAVRLEPRFSEAYLQLGILYTDQRNFPQAVAAYQRAIEANPRLEEAHYRLAQVYRQMGEAAKAHAELALYEQIAKENTGETERERREIKQFVYTLRDQTAASPLK
jgi:tetratricopeptide (TPR) repeat protein